MTALSRADPTRPIDWVMPIRPHAAWKVPAVYSLPLTPFCLPGPRRG